MGAKVGTGKSFDDMNLTPLIDVVLVVLIIMMVSLPVQVSAMGVKLPCLGDACPKPPDTLPEDVEQLVISIYALQEGDTEQKVALNLKLMAPEKISFELNRRLRNMSKKNVFIDADLDSDYGVIVDMIDLARKEGAEKVGLAKAKEGGPRPWTSVDSGAMPRGIFPGSPIVTPSDPGGVGMITEKKADEGFQPIMPALEGCYVTALQKQPDLTGRLMPTVRLNPDGSLYDDPSMLGSNMEGDSTELEACILEALKAYRAAPLGEGNTAAVTFPLIFSPG
ncbi:MAG: biopolymer transporter ExbD [Myxococcota bacterium]